MPFLVVITPTATAPACVSNLQVEQHHVNFVFTHTIEMNNSGIDP